MYVFALREANNKIRTGAVDDYYDAAAAAAGVIDVVVRKSRVGKLHTSTIHTM